MTEQQIHAQHPDSSKKGVNISRRKYVQVRSAIVQSLREEGQMTFTELGDSVSTILNGHFEGAVGWYYTTVKLNLEARGIMERVGKGTPRRLRLVEKTLKD